MPITISLKLQTLLLGLTILATSCAPQKQAPSIANYVGKKQITTSLEILKSTPSPLQAKDFNIVLSSEIFGKMILLSTAIIEGAPTPAGKALANKIIYFKKQKHKVYMFESLEGQLSTNSITTEKLIAEFNIVESSSSSVTIDFKNGMNSLFMNSSMYGSDFSGPDALKDTVVPVTSSFLNKVELRGKYLYINEIARVTIAGKNDSIELKYVLSMYEKNKTFQSKASNKQVRVGYFEVNPIIEAGSGKETINIMKFNPNKSITYHLSQNIPEQYQQAVKDGVLYWNSVFGKEIMKLDVLAKDRDVHEPELNVVRWLHWDSAGFAYANMQADPLSGETLQSEIYMTSVFGLGGLRRAKIYYNRIQSNEKPVAQSKLLLRGFDSAKTCNFDYQKSHGDLGQIISKVENSGVSESEQEKMFLRLSQDYVRSVTAHEIGHTLGLRHNFAGNTTTGLTYKNFDSVFKKYLITGTFDQSMHPTSTVMDYTPTSVASMNGAFIRLKRGALKYDKAAIDWGYGLSEVKLKDIPVFCTDSHRGKNLYADCKVWDYLDNPIEGSLYTWENDLKNIGIDLAYAFKKMLELPEDQAIEKIKELKIRADKKAKSIVSDAYGALLNTVKANANFVNIKTKYQDQLDYYSEQLYKEDVLKFQNDSVNKHRGISNILLSKLKIKNGKTVARIEAESLFNSILKSTLVDSSAELTELVDQFKVRYFQLFERELLLNAGQSLSLLKLTIKDQNFIKDLKKLIEHVSFDRSNETLLSSELVVIKKPLFNYQVPGKDSYGRDVILDIRSIISKLINVNFYPDSPSYQRNISPVRAELKSKFKAQKESILELIPNNELSDDLYDWLAKENTILKSLK